MHPRPRAPSRFFAALPLSISVVLCLPGVAWSATTLRVSVASDGTQGNGFSATPMVSSNGRFVAFYSSASNLVPGDTNGATDVFIYDRLTGITERVSLDGAGSQANGASQLPYLSGDGRFVTFWSTATNLVSGDTNGAADVFLRDRQAGTTERISVGTGGTQTNGGSFDGDLSDDGRYVQFSSDATNLVAGDTNGVTDVFVRDRTAGTTTLVSVSTTGSVGNGRSSQNSGSRLSADGRFVVFPSQATNLVVGGSAGVQVFVRDLVAGTTEVASVSTSGVQGGGTNAWPAVSSDGRYVVFSSTAPNLVTGDTNSTWDIFLRDRQTGTTERVSLGAGGVQANANNGYSCVSDDGRYVSFTSYATNLVAGDTNGIQDVFVRDRLLGTTERVSVSSSGAQGTGPGDELGLTSLSGDGRFVAFPFAATNLVSGDTNGQVDAFLRDSAGEWIMDEAFDDDFLAGRRVPDGVDSTRSTTFAPIDGCRPGATGKPQVVSRDISSFSCPPPERLSCCGPALGFTDGGGSYVTLRYVVPAGAIATGSYVTFQVVGYGGDAGQLFKYVSTDGTAFTPVGTDQDAMGNYTLPLPTGSSEAFFRLQVGNTSIFDGIIVDNFHAVLYNAPQAPVSVVEGGGSACVFNAEPFCHPPDVTAPASATGAEGNPLSVIASASDPDGDPISSLTAGPLPSGAAFTANGAKTSGTLNWTPSYTQAGVYGVTFAVTGTIGTDSAATAITIAATDRAPMVTAPAGAAGTPGSSLMFTVSAADPDGEAIASLTGSPLPSGASFTANGSNSSGTFNWTPATGQEGVHNVIFTAANSLSGTAATSISIGLPPGAPGPCSASDGVPTFINITWNDVAGEDGYRVYRSGLLIQTTGPNVTSATDVPDPGTYTYCVEAFNVYGTSAQACDAGSKIIVVGAPMAGPLTTSALFVVLGSLGAIAAHRRRRGRSTGGAAPD